MLIIAPSHVTFDGVRINDVESIAIEHASDQLIVEYTDTSRDPAFADVASRRTTVKVSCLLRRAPSQPFLDPAPGAMGVLSFTTGPAQAATAPAAVVSGVTYQLASLPKGAVARRVVEFVLTAPSGQSVLTTSILGGVS